MRKQKRVYALGTESLPTAIPNLIDDDRVSKRVVKETIWNLKVVFVGATNPTLKIQILFSTKVLDIFVFSIKFRVTVGRDAVPKVYRIPPNHVSLKFTPGTGPATRDN